jgi:hypothetical protein
MPRPRRRQLGSAMNKKRKTRIFFVDIKTRFAYNNLAEAIKPGNEEITR